MATSFIVRPPLGAKGNPRSSMLEVKLLLIELGAKRTVYISVAGLTEVNVAEYLNLCGGMSKDKPNSAKIQMTTLHR